MDKVNFQTNMPVELRLRALEGRPVESQFGGNQHMFSSDAGVFYVSETVGQILTAQFHKLGIKPAEAVEVCKREVAKPGGRKAIEWQVVRVHPPVAEQTNGTYAVPAPLESQLAASIEQANARKAAPAPAWAEMLVNQTTIMVDAYAAVVRHSAKHEGLVKSEDIRSIFLSAFINLTGSKNGGRNAA